jgi:hypothetical protein
MWAVTAETRLWDIVTAMRASTGIPRAHPYTGMAGSLRGQILSAST